VRKLKVSARDLLFALRNRMPRTVHYLDTETGEVIPVFGFNRDKLLAQVRADRARYLRLAPESSRRGYEIMRRFISLVGDREARLALEQAAAGKHAFRRFREELDRWPGEKSRWQRFRAEMTAEPLKAKLAAAGIELELSFDSDQSLKAK
jgi:hypothetical protein